MKNLLLLLFLCTPIAAQTLPEAPNPQLENKYDCLVWGGVAGAHAADYFLTEQCVTKYSARCREGVLPGFVWRHKPVLALTEGFFSATQIVISHDLRKHGHKTLARIWDAANLIAFTGVDFYVYRLEHN